MSLDFTSKLVKNVDSTENQINIGSDNNTATKTVVGATALDTGMKSKKKTVNFPSQSKVTTNDILSAEEEF